MKWRRRGIPAAPPQQANGKMLHQTIVADPAAHDFEHRRDDRMIALTFAAATVYATVRYNVLKGVPWSDWPHFIGNKVLALTSLVLIALAVLRLASSRPRPIRRLMTTGSALALTHTLLSLALNRPEYFDKFFAGTKLSLAGGVSLLLGAIAMALLNAGRGQPGSSRPLGAAVPLGTAALLSGIHAAAPSVATWFSPVTWPGYLPPITLISFAIGCIAVTGPLRLLRQRRVG